MPWWVTALWVVGTYVLGELLRPKPEIEDRRPADLGDFNFPTASERRKQPLLWGTAQVAGPNVLWYGDFVAEPITETQRTGLFSSEEFVTGYRYHVGIQMGLCRGTVDALRKIWIGEKLVYSTPVTASGDIELQLPNLFGGNDVGGNGGISGTLTFHNGSKTQAVDSYLSGFQSPTPAYRGMCYVTWQGPSAGTVVYTTDISVFTITTELKKGYLGNSPSIEAWSFELQRIPNGLGLTGGKEVVNGVDANPMNVLYEILTDDEWGLGFPASDIDTTSFTTAADTLFTEGNGFSFVLTSPMDITDLIRELERQIDGLIFFNRATAKWDITLARGGYTVGTLDPLNKTNVKEVKDWRKGSWDDTVNQVFVNYSVYDSTTEEWKQTSAGAPDIANFNVQGEFIPVDINFPGCKNSALANILATRELRGRSFPTSGGTLILNRSQYDINPGDLRRFTWDDDGLDYTDLPLRINKVRSVDRDTIEVDVSEDIFVHEAAIVADPDESGWTPPADALQPIPTDEDQVVEAPRAFVLRSASPSNFDRIWVGARHQDDGAATIRAYTRHASGTPTGSYAYDVGIASFLKIGQLNATLAPNTSNPTVSTTEDIRVDADDNTVSEIVAALSASASVSELGQNLVNLVAVGDEILGVTQVIDNTTHLLLRVVYRGFLDTTPREHAAGSKVYVLRGALGQTVYPRTHNVDVQLRGISISDVVTEGEANTVQITLADRGRAPYPTTDLAINGTRYSQATESLDDTTSGSGTDQVGLNVDATFRDFALYDQVQSTLGTLSDSESNWQSANSVQIQARITDDPAGSPTVLFTTALQNALQANMPILLSRTEILANNDGVVPSTVRVETIMEHTVPDPDGGADIQVNDLFHDTLDVDVNSAALSGLDNTGARAQNVVSASFTADVTDTYVFTMGTDLLTSGALEVRLNGGSFTTVISSGGGTSGTIAVTSGDTVEWRHTQSGSGNTYTHLSIQQQTGSVDEAYGVLIV